MSGSLIRHERLHVALLSAVALTIALLLALLLRSNYRQAEEGAEATARNLTLTLVTRVDSSLRRISADLDYISSNLPAEALRADKRAQFEATVHRNLQVQARQFPELVGYRVVDVEGNHLYASDPVFVPANLGDRDWFRAAKAAAGDDLIFSHVIQGRVNRGNMLVIAKPLRDVRDRFAGAAVAAINLDVFASIFRELNIGPHGVVALRRSDDATLLLRWPPLPEQVNRPVASPVVDRISRGERQGVMRFAGPVDGVDRLYAFRLVDSSPLVVAVAQATDDYLAHWWVLTLTAIAAVVLGVAVLFNYFRRRAQARSRDAFMVQQLRDSDELHRAIIHQAGDGIDLVDVESLRFVEVSEASCSMLGYAADELLALRLVEVMVCDKENELRAELERRRGDGDLRIETRARRKDGSLIDIDLGFRIIQYHGRDFIVGVWRDITERKKLDAQLHLGQVAFTNAQEAIVVTDETGAILDVNPAFTAITGYSRAEAIGQNPRMLQSGRQEQSFYAAMWQSLLDSGRWEGEFWNRRKDGSVYLQHIKISAVTDGSGRATRFVGVAADITELRDSQSRVEHMAYYDPLTNLPNRTLLADHLKLAIAQADRRQEVLAICYLDLDGFKPVNDTWGHEAGDQLLVEAARRLQACVRLGDTVARLGGDEFVLLLGGGGDSHQIEQAVRRTLRTVAEPYRIGEADVALTASIGVTIYPRDDDDADALVRHADQAMYVAKRSGKNRYHLFDADSDRKLKADGELLSRVEAGLAADEFCLHYQPKVDMRRGTVIGAEALIRWNHPTRGLLPPAAFLATVDDSPLAVTLGEWVLRRALAQLTSWVEQGTVLPLSVNISGRHLQHPDFVLKLKQLLDDFPRVEPHWLELEILETTAMEDVDQVSRIMHRCNALGVSFSLDDFGTGFASLTYFRRLPTQLVKIDRSFIKDILDDPDDLAIVEGVVGLARTFRRQVIAEGVETLGHGVPLLRVGCELAQGYAIARPMPAADIPAWVEGWQVPREWAGAVRIARISNS